MLDERCNQTDLDDAVMVLREFTDDIEAVYRDNEFGFADHSDLIEEWPDLELTYLHARQVLAKLAEGR